MFLLLQYFSPYKLADMRKMANAFNCTVNQLENELMPLILEGQIQARIDSQNKVSTGKLGIVCRQTQLISWCGCLFVI